MPAMLAGLLTWFASFFGATLIGKVAGLVVFSGLSQVMVSFFIDQVISVASGAPAEILTILNLIGIWDALGVIAGAWTLILTIRAYSVGPGAAITGA